MKGLTRMQRGMIIALLPMLAWLAWEIFRPNPLLGAADSAVMAFRAGNEATLMSYASPAEIVCSDLTAEKIRAAHRLLVADLLEGSRLVSRTGGEMNTNAYQSSATERYIGPDGEPIQFSMVMNRTDDGPKAAVLIALLTQRLSYGRDVKHRSKESSVQMADDTAYWAPKLEAIGLKKVMLNPGACITWAELETIFRRSAALEAENEVASKKAAKSRP